MLAGAALLAVSGGSSAARPSARRARARHRHRRRARLSIARAALRYGERLASHDAALRGIAALRVRVFHALVPHVPGDVRSGELLDRCVADVDRLQDVWLRGLWPIAVAALASAACVVAAAVILPAAGLVLAAVLVAGAALVAPASRAAARQAARRQAPARAALAADLVEAIHGAAELAVAGREAETVARLRDDDARRPAWRAATPWPGRWRPGRAPRWPPARWSRSWPPPCRPCRRHARRRTARRAGAARLRRLRGRGAAARGGPPARRVGHRRRAPRGGDGGARPRRRPRGAAPRPRRRRAGRRAADRALRVGPAVVDGVSLTLAPGRGWPSSGPAARARRRWPTRSCASWTRPAAG